MQQLAAFIQHSLRPLLCPCQIRFVVVCELYSCFYSPPNSTCALLVYKIFADFISFPVPAVWLVQVRISRLSSDRTLWVLLRVIVEAPTGYVLTLEIVLQVLHKRIIYIFVVEEFCHSGGLSWGVLSLTLLNVSRTFYYLALIARILRNRLS